MQGFFVTGTDTDVGKTVVASWLVARLGANYWKPVQAGTDPETDSDTVRRLACVAEDRILPEPGRFNACTPPGAHTIGELMESGKRVSGANATFVWADAAFIQKNGLMEKGEIPIWLPPTGPLAGALLVSSARAVQQGLRFRDLDTTVRDTLDWYNKRPADQRKLAVGLTPEREAELLKQITAKG